MSVPAGRPGLQPEDRPAGHLFQVEPEIREWARAAVPLAENYLKTTINPIMESLEHEISHRKDDLGEHYFPPMPSIKQRVDHLRSLVETLPGEMAHQISNIQPDAAGNIGVDQIHPPLEREINSMQHDMPWMAPILVRLRHALSRQALVDNVARPAAEQTGLT